MAVQNTKLKANNLMLWVRILLPIVLAALGWYIGQTVGNLEERLRLIEAHDKQMDSALIEHRSEANAKIDEILRRLQSHELTTKDIVTMERFSAKESAQDRRIERIEDRLNTEKK